MPLLCLQGAIVGMILSHIITIWAAIGHLMVKSKAELLPLSVEVSFYSYCIAIILYIQIIIFYYYFRVVQMKPSQLI